MAKNSCGSRATSRNEVRSALGEDRDAPREPSPAAGAGLSSGLAVDLDLHQLRQRIALFGDPHDQVAYLYIVDTVHPRGRLQVYEQRGSAPNWEGGYISLCTCKHSMRTTLKPEQWTRGKWVAAMTGYNRRFNYQQSLICLFRVGEAHASMAAMAHALRTSGREAVADVKDASLHPRGDLMKPIRTGMSSNPHDPRAYHEPCPDHVHHQPSNPQLWQTDIDYVGRSGRRPPMLVGDPKFSFRWTHPMVRRRDGAGFRNHQPRSFIELLDQLEAV
jgi:hypothetical protein